MTYALLVLAGALLCNCIPHLASGLRGEAFPTPFASPPGKGLSPPVTNFVWGAANLVFGVQALTTNLDAADPRFGKLALLAGFVGLGLYLSRHMGQVRAARAVSVPLVQRKASAQHKSLVAGEMPVEREVPVERAAPVTGEVP